MDKSKVERWHVEMSKIEAEYYWIEIGENELSNLLVIEGGCPSQREIRVPILLASEGARNSIASEGVWEYLNILTGFWSWEALEFLA